MTAALSRHRRNAAAEPVVAMIESLNYDGRGVAHVDGKTVFIEGALPGETVAFRYSRRHRRYDTGRATDVLAASPDRVSPPCPYYSVCGGCSLQHLRPEAQIRAKQGILAEQLARIGRVTPETWLPPITGPVWGYRRRARLGVRLVPKKGGILVGFRERRRSFITNLDACLTLVPQASALLPALRELVSQLSCPDRIPQIELAAGEGATAFVFRHLVPLAEADVRLLQSFGERHALQIYVQGGAPDTIVAVWPQEPAPLFYRLPAYDVEIRFRPADFVQVNSETNRRIVEQSIALLEVAPDEQVLDLFSGLGNFTLALARRARRVLGIEADPALVDGARANAAVNGIANAEFRAADLYADDAGESAWRDFTYQKVLLDPPRSGAIEAIKRLGATPPARIVYVSCYPATLARDSEYLVHVLGYRFAAAGVMDMFPQTSHVESIALFVRP